MAALRKKDPGPEKGELSIPAAPILPPPNEFVLRDDCRRSTPRRELAVPADAIGIP